MLTIYVHKATFGTTEDCLTLLIHIPIHAGCDIKPDSDIDERNGSAATERTTETATESSKKATEKTAEKL